MVDGDVETVDPTRLPNDGFSLGTQELRIAAAFTGGVSLAIWMGGLAREINLLRAASALRGGLTWQEPSAPSRKVRALYQALLDVVDVKISVDVLAGTSAGGINAPVLALANVHAADLGTLRDVWLDDGALQRLLQHPKKSEVRSLLNGDFLRTNLQKTMADIAAVQAPNTSGTATRVFITTTLLTGEAARFTDDYGTQIHDRDHHGLFTFDRAMLTDAAIAEPLSLAARCSSAFPFAFEPELIPIGADEGELPDMAGYTRLARNHWAADGGILANRPLRPALQAIFDRPSRRQVRRALAYIVPTSSAGKPFADEVQAEPPSLGKALFDDMGAAVAQSISSDLTALQDHNARVSARDDARALLAGLPRPPGTRLLTPQMYETFRQSRAQARAGTAVAEVLRVVATWPDGDLGRADDPNAWAAFIGFGPGESRLRRAGTESALAMLPSAVPTTDLTDWAQLGTDAFDAVKATLLALLRRAALLAPAAERRAQLAAAATRVHDASEAFRAGDWTPLPDLVSVALADRTVSPMDVVRSVTQQWLEELAHPLTRDEAWRQLAVAATTVAGLVASILAERATDLEAPDRARARAYLATVDAYVEGFPRDPLDPFRGLGELALAAEAFAPGGDFVDQPVEFVQLSADTQMAFDARKLASEKLTGLQVFHFGAFYRGAWRANDWMWGRLDGAGWLVHVLLDPRRLRTLCDAHDGDALGYLADLRASLRAIAGRDPEPDVSTELAFLTDPAAELPPSLPRTARWVAQGLQELIAAEELGFVAEQIRRDYNDGAWSNDAERSFLNEYRAATAPGGGAPSDTLSAASARALLPVCDVSNERLQAEIGSALLARTGATTLVESSRAVGGAMTGSSVLRPVAMMIRVTARCAATLVLAWSWVVRRFRKRTRLGGN